MKFKNQKGVLSDEEHVKLVTVNEDGSVKDTKVFAQAKNIPKEYNKYTVRKVTSVTSIPMEAEQTEPEKPDENKKEDVSAPAPNTRKRTRPSKPATYASGTEIQVQKPLSKKKKKKQKYSIENIEEGLKKWQ